MTLKTINLDISIIIVNFNTKVLLKNCIKSIVDNIHNIEYEIIIVDNNSTDNSVDCCILEYKTFPNIFFIKLDQNLGFSKANNIGAKKANGKLLHFLNPDTEVRETLNSDYSLALSNEKESVYVNPLANPNEPPKYGKNYMPTVWNYLVYRIKKQKAKYYYIGASIIIQKNTFYKIGQWNELFFMYIEDAEIFYKINYCKIPIIELNSIINHLGGGSSSDAFKELYREALIQKSFRLFYKIHRNYIEYCIMQIFILATFWKKPKRLYWQIKAIKHSWNLDK